MPTRSRRRPRRYVETSDFLRAVSRLLASAGRRVGDADIEELRELLLMQDQVEEALVAAVAGLREAGTTWEEIGEAAGTTRQAALMRWNPKLQSRQNGARPV